MKNIILTSFSTVMLLSSCLKNSNPTCNYNACGIIASAAEIQALQNYISANSLTAV